MPKSAVLNDEEVARQVYNDVEWARGFRQAYETDWKAFYKLYKNFLDQADYPYDTYLAIPTAYSLVETQTAFLVDMIFEAGDFVEVLGKTAIGQFSASAVKQMLNYHFRHSIKTYEELTKFVRQLLCFGTSIFRMKWSLETGHRTHNHPILNDAGEVVGYGEKTQREITSNKPVGYTVDILNFGVDPNAGSLDDARFCFEEMWIDVAQLAEKGNTGAFERNAVLQVMPADCASVNKALSDKLSEIKIPHHQDSPYIERNKIHCIDYWGYITTGWEGAELRNAKTQLYHVVLALKGSTSVEGEPVVLLKDVTPYHHGKLPFIDSRLNALPGEFYGTGDLEYCEPLLNEQRDMRNLKLTNLTRTTNRMYKINREAGIDKAQLIWKPSGWIECDDPTKDVVPLETQPIDPAHFAAEEEIRRDVEQVTGVNDFIMGQYRSSTGFNDTATGISLIQQVALKRIAAKGQIVQRAVKDMGEMLFNLVAQFQDENEPIRILDPDSMLQWRFIPITPQALNNQYDFHIVNSPSLGSKPIRQNQLIQILQILGAIKQQGANIDFDLGLYARRLLEEMDVPNPNDFLGHKLDQPLPGALQGPQPGFDDYISPEEENRLMMEVHQNVLPKLQENHYHHMAVHREAFEMAGEDNVGKQIVADHYNAHARMADQTKELAQQAIETGVLRDQAEQQQRRLRMLETGGNKSPTAAGGREGPVRAMGNLSQGNV